MGRPPGSKNKSTPNPVRQQVRDLSGFGSREELAASLPESTATPGTAAAPEKVRKPRTPKTDATDDPRYNKAVANMTSFGGGRAVKTAFKTAATVMDKKEIALDATEEEMWDDYFYVVGKKSNFDPTRPWYLVFYAFILLLEQVTVRIWKMNEKSFVNHIAKMFGIGGEEETGPTEKPEEEETEDE